MGQSPVKKVIYLLNVDDYAPEITALTYPLIYYYADKIGANVAMITERKFPGWPPVYEKLQIYERAQRNGADWHIYIDSDALIHPETIDFTEFLPRDTVAHHGVDFANVRWRYDRFFRRDGRAIGSCNWLTIASDWCIELWEPLKDLTREQAVANILPTVEESNTIITAEHLIDDYVLSRNIAKYGLKYTTLQDLMKRIGLGEANFFWHAYLIPVPEKAEQMKRILAEHWKLPAKIRYWGPGGGRQ